MAEQFHSEVYAYTCSNKHVYTNVHSSTFHNIQKVETTQMPINEWMNEGNMVHTCNRILLTHKKEQCTVDIDCNMDCPCKHYAK